MKMVVDTTTFWGMVVGSHWGRGSVACGEEQPPARLRSIPATAARRRRISELSTPPRLRSPITTPPLTHLST